MTDDEMNERVGEWWKHSVDDAFTENKILKELALLIKTREPFVAGQPVTPEIVPVLEDEIARMCAHYLAKYVAR